MHQNQFGGTDPLEELVTLPRPFIWIKEWVRDPGGRRGPMGRDRKEVEDMEKGEGGWNKGRER